MDKNESTTVTSGPDGAKPPKTQTRRFQWVWIAGAAVVLLLLVAVVLAVVALVRRPEQAEVLRDVVIILMATEFLFIGLALIVLMVQLARLTALVQNEIQPILESTQETINTLRGTTAFLSKNLVEPVIRVNSSVSVVRQALQLFRPRRR